MYVGGLFMEIYIVPGVQYSYGFVLILNLPWLVYYSLHCNIIHITYSQARQT